MNYKLTVRDVTGVAYPAVQVTADKPSDLAELMREKAEAGHFTDNLNGLSIFIPPWAIAGVAAEPVTKIERV